MLCLLSFDTLLFISPRFFSTSKVKGFRPMTSLKRFSSYLSPIFLFLLLLFLFVLLSLNQINHCIINNHPEPKNELSLISTINTFNYTTQLSPHSLFTIIDPKYYNDKTIFIHHLFSSQCGGFHEAFNYLFSYSHPSFFFIPHERV